MPLALFVSRNMASKTKQLALNFQDRDVIGRDLNDFIFAVEHRSQPARAVPEIGVPEQFGRPALHTRLGLDSLDLGARLRRDERVARIGSGGARPGIATWLWRAAVEVIAAPRLAVGLAPLRVELGDAGDKVVQ
jgi:hypothetical protein